MKDLSKEMLEDLKEVLFALNHLQLEGQNQLKKAVRKHKVVSELEGTNLQVGKMLLEEILVITRQIPNPNLTKVQQTILNAKRDKARQDAEIKEEASI